MLAMRSERVTREIAAVRDKYPNASEVEESGGATVLIVPTFPLPLGFTAPTARIMVRIPSLYPTEKLDLFWLDPAIQRVNGAGLPNVMATGVSIAGTLWTQISWHDNSPHDPSRVNVLGFISTIATWFRSQTKSG